MALANEIKKFERRVWIILQNSEFTQGLHFEFWETVSDNNTDSARDICKDILTGWTMLKKENIEMNQVDGKCA